MEPSDLTVHILREIRDATRSNGERIDAMRADINRNGERIDAMRADINRNGERIDGLGERIDAMADRIHGLERAAVHGFEQVTARLEHLRDFSGDRYRDHEDRIRAIERWREEHEATG